MAKPNNLVSFARLSMLQESLGCALALLLRSMVDASEIKAAKREIESAMKHLRNASEIVDKARGTYR